MKLFDVRTVAVGQRVNVGVKVVKVMVKSDTKVYGKVLLFQNVLVCDESGSSRIVLWEGDIGKMKENLMLLVMQK